MMDKADYEKHIPERCKLKTADEHQEVLGDHCWGLMASIKSRMALNCRSCEFAGDLQIISSDAATIIGVSQSTLRSWNSRNKGIQPTQKGWSNKYSLIEVENFALHYRKRRV